MGLWLLCACRESASVLHTDAHDRYWIGIPENVQESPTEPWALLREVWRPVASGPLWRSWYDKDDLMRISKKYRSSSLHNNESLHAAEVWNTKMIAELPHFVPHESHQHLGGLPRVVYSPALVRGWLRNLDPLKNCLASQRDCFERPLTEDSIAIKALWAPKGLTIDQHCIGEDQSWQLVSAVSPHDAFTITTKDQSEWQLVAMHLAVKNMEHWLWISLWWTPTINPEVPEDLAFLRQYQMCFVDTRAPWEEQRCSNPFLEKGQGMAATNCVGCHQFASADSAKMNSLANSRLTTQSTYDYMWTLLTDAYLLQWAR